MRTTALFVELLVVGSQTLVCIILGLVLLYDVSKVFDLLKVVESWIILISLITTALIYTAGIIIERIGGMLCPIKNIKLVIEKFNFLRKLAEKHGVNSIREFRFYENKGVETAEYTLTRIRIIRATIINYSIAYFLLLTSILFSTSRIVQAQISFFWISFAYVIGIILLTIVLIALTMSYMGIEKILEPTDVKEK